jgi:hypothetical protein
MQRANADRLSAIGHGSRPEKKKGKEKPKGRFDGRADELHGRGLADFVHDLVLSFLFSFFFFFLFFFFFFFFSHLPVVRARERALPINAIFGFRVSPFPAGELSENAAAPSFGGG